MKEPRTVTIDPDQHKLLREYSQRDGKTAEEAVHEALSDYIAVQRIKEYSNAMGVPMDHPVREALSDFIECCVSTRLETLQKRLHKRVTQQPAEQS
jgi:hypothetical protein